jgi:LytS/YehU family sensor histidine kinase
MKRFLTRPTSAVLQKLARILAIILVFAIAFGIYLRLRGYPYYHLPPPFSLADLTRIEIHRPDAGLFLQLTIVPVFLFYLLTIIPYFRRLLQDQTVLHATLGVFVGLAAIQLVSQTYEMLTSRSTNEPIYIGFLVIMIGSLLGGWRIGPALGVISTLFLGLFELLTMTPFPEDVRALGLWRVIQGTDWGPFLYINFLNPHFSVGIWVGVLACLCADLLGPHRYSSLAAMGLGVGLVFAAGYLRLAGGMPPALVDVPAQALLTSLAAGAVMLMLHNLQVEAARQKAEAAELVQTQTELRALRAQINPHFLFNALNTIRYMIRTDPETARRLLLDLSEVFQRTLRSGDFVSLRDELSYVEAYLSLEEARLNERLCVTWGGVLQPATPLQTDTPLLDQLVPTLTLQPIVENAVIHGVGQKRDGGTVTIMVEQMGSDLVVKVDDDGVGIDPLRLSEVLDQGEDIPLFIGLRNVDKRLRLLYGEDHRLIIESEVGHGTRVVIRIPMAKN